MRGIRRGAGRPVFFARRGGERTCRRRGGGSARSRLAARAARLFASCGPRRPAFLRAAAGSARFLPLSHKSFTEWRGPTFTFSENHAIIL